MDVVRELDSRRILSKLGRAMNIEALLFRRESYGSRTPSKDTPDDSANALTMHSDAFFVRRTSSTLAVSSCILLRKMSGLFKR